MEVMHNWAARSDRRVLHVMACWCANLSTQVGKIRNHAQQCELPLTGPDLAAMRPAPRAPYARTVAPHRRRSVRPSASAGRLPSVIPEETGGSRETCHDCPYTHELIGVPI